ncbi:PAAR domain-containing protein [Burkholderia ambifaria]|uniref:PAAR repeat-containing protein n=1 Tax=Burkholderia ambifaria MEX-5 TaxID=396597 RepID=B1T8J3_9BURK|nr:PAAR domain-containing protein [Burkholderia ambifaria]EDT40123.1 PAAR repeat-containing protein [Burkholderia ambifaria MEX-5]
MSISIAVVGDTTDHGGRIITGSDTHKLGGKKIARLHDLVDCPETYPDGRPHGINKIIEAHPTLSVGGRYVALHGHRTECGCRLIAASTAKVGR